MKLEFEGLHYRKLRWRRAIQDFRRIDADLAMGFARTWAVTHQPAIQHIFAELVNRGSFCCAAKAIILARRVSKNGLTDTSIAVTRC
jgi:hypothetical protein